MMFDLIYLYYRIRYGKEVANMKYKFLVILLANEVLAENMSIDDVPAKLQAAVREYIKEKFDVEV